MNKAAKTPGFNGIIRPLAARRPLGCGLSGLSRSILARHGWNRPWRRPARTVFRNPRSLHCSLTRNTLWGIWAGAATSQAVSVNLHLPLAPFSRLAAGGVAIGDVYQTLQGHRAAAAGVSNWWVPVFSPRACRDLIERRLTRVLQTLGRHVVAAPELVFHGRGSGEPFSLWRAHADLSPKDGQEREEAAKLAGPSSPRPMLRLLGRGPARAPAQRQPAGPTTEVFVPSLTPSRLRSFGSRTDAAPRLLRTRRATGVGSIRRPAQPVAAARREEVRTEAGRLIRIHFDGRTRQRTLTNALYLLHRGDGSRSWPHPPYDRPPWSRWLGQWGVIESDGPWTAPLPNPEPVNLALAPALRRLLQRGKAGVGILIHAPTAKREREAAPPARALATNRGSSKSMTRGRPVERRLAQSSSPPSQQWLSAKLKEASELPAGRQTPPPPPAIDLQQLTDRVCQELERKIRIEKERRGL